MIERVAGKDQHRASISSSVSESGKTVTGIGKAAAATSDHRDERAGTLLGGTGGEHQDRNVAVFLDQAVDLG